VECLDKNRNKVYYANVVTKETTWSFPQELMNDKSAVDQPDHWVEAVDAQSKKKYYYNKITRETSWHKPKCLEPRRSNANFMDGRRNSGSQNLASLLSGLRPVDPSSESNSNEEAPSCPRAGATSPHRGIALPGMDRNSSDNRGRSVSPLPSQVKAERLADRSTSPPPAKGKTKASAFAALRALEEQERLSTSECPEDEHVVGFDDSTMPRGYIRPPSSTVSSMSEAFPVRPSTCSTVSIYDNLGADTLTTADLIAKATMTMEQYAEMHFKFDRKGILGGVTTTEKLLSWKNELLRTALHPFHGELLSDSLQLFRNITGYMGDRETNKSQKDHAHKILTVALLSSQELRDELLCQICKQLTGNPSSYSRKQGWQLLLICLTTVAPSDDLLPALLSFCKSHMNDNDESIAQLAEVTLHKCYKSATMLGIRHEVPSVVEMEALKQIRCIKVRVWFVDGKHMTLDCDSWVSVSELEDIIAIKLGIHSASAFGLYEVSTTEDERPLKPEERILDLVAVWQHIELEDIANGKNDDNSHIEEFRFVYKVKYFLDINESDKAGIEMMYIQAVFDVVNSTYMCMVEDAYTLAALQMQEKYGDYDENTAGSIIRYSLGSLLPQRNLTSTNNTVAICEKVLRKYAKLAGYSNIETRLSYLDFVKQFPSYGSAYYFATPAFQSNLPKELAIAINNNGVSLVDNYSKEYIEQYKYQDIITWGHSPSQFVLAVGTLANQKKLTFNCTDGKDMSDMIHAYVDSKPKPK